MGNVEKICIGLVVAMVIAMFVGLGFAISDTIVALSSPHVFTGTVTNIFTHNSIYGYQTQVTFLYGKIEAHNIEFLGLLEFEIGSTYKITYYKTNNGMTREITSIEKIS